jgi:hypothetical protein
MSMEALSPLSTRLGPSSNYLLTCLGGNEGGKGKGERFV